MIIATPSAADLADELAAKVPTVARHSKITMHVPVDVADEARGIATDRRADVVVSIGGGSTTGLAKAVALTTGLPIVAVPTTYAGSEATTVWGITEAGRKITGVDPRVLPRSVVYDAALRSAAGALQRGVRHERGRPLRRRDVGDRTRPDQQGLALEGVRTLNVSRPMVVEIPRCPTRRETRSTAPTSPPSRSQRRLRAAPQDLPRPGRAVRPAPRRTHAVVLPHVVALNALAVPDLDQRIAAALDAPSTLAGVEQLARTTGAPVALRDLGMHEADIVPAIAPILAVVPPSNPVPVTAANLEHLVYAAWAGSAPPAPARAAADGQP